MNQLKKLWALYERNLLLVLSGLWWLIGISRMVQAYHLGVFSVACWCFLDGWMAAALLTLWIDEYKERRHPKR